MNPRGQSRSSSECGEQIAHFDQPTAPDWAWLFAQDPHALAQLVHAGTSLLWVERFMRGLDQRLDGALELPEPVRQAATPSWLPSDVVPIVAAQAGGAGILGTMRIRASDQALGSVFTHARATEGSDSELLRASIAGSEVASNTLAELLPDAPRPVIDIDVDHDGSGDSVALAAGIASILHLFGKTWPGDMIATGGIDIARGWFTPVAASTLASKAAAARRWGYRRIALVEGCDETDGMDEIDGLVIERIPADPAGLAVAIASMQGIDLDDQNVAHALTIFDLRVGRAGPHMLDRVLETTEPFMGRNSPLVRHVALDMRSRAYLHAGHVNEAHEALQEADALRGQGDLPDGRLRDVLRYQQPAHRSIVYLDLGEWSDQVPAHAAVDALIADLDSAWPTKHERLMRLFLANTRARRYEYLGRLHSDAGRFDAAWSDLMHAREAWDELLEQFARDELKLPDTSRARMENQLVDVAFSRIASCGELPDAWRGVIEDQHSRRSPVVGGSGDAVLEFTMPSGDSCLIGGCGFDAIARLKTHRVLGTPGLPEDLEVIRDATSCTAHADVMYPWFHWLELAALTAREESLDIPVPGGGGDITGFQRAWNFVLGNPGGIRRIIAMRSAVILETLGRPMPFPEPPDGDTPLRSLFDELAADLDSIVHRVPY